MVGNYVKHKWQPLREKFFRSKYFCEINAFLKSDQLAEFLEKTGCTMEFKLHPIFAAYKQFFEFGSERIGFAAEDIIVENYMLFLTDFSSYAFDFEYLGIPVIHFIPDTEEFKSGLNGYRELNYPKSFWDDVANNHADTVKKLWEYSWQKNEGAIATFYSVANIRDEIYYNIKNVEYRQ